MALVLLLFTEPPMADSTIRRLPSESQSTLSWQQTERAPSWILVGCASALNQAGEPLGPLPGSLQVLLPAGPFDRAALRSHAPSVRGAFSSLSRAARLRAREEGVRILAFDEGAVVACEILHRLGPSYPFYVGLIRTDRQLEKAGELENRVQWCARRDLRAGGAVFYNRLCDTLAPAWKDIFQPSSRLLAEQVDTSDVVRRLESSVGPFRGFPAQRDDQGHLRAARAVCAGEVVSLVGDSDMRPVERPLRLEDSAAEIVGKTKLQSEAMRPGKPDAEPWLGDQASSVAAEFLAPTLGGRSGVIFPDGRADLFFAVRRSKPGRVAVLLTTNTFNAYSVTAGRSLYDHPILTEEVSERRHWNQTKAYEWRPTVAWLESHATLAPEIDYLIDSDLGHSGALDAVDLLVVVGHAEYWTSEAVGEVRDFVFRGGRLIILGGNTFWWRTSYDRAKQVLGIVKNKHNPRRQEHALSATGGWTAQGDRNLIVRLTGGDFGYGGFGRSRQPGSLRGAGMYVVEPESPAFAGLNLEAWDWLDVGRIREFDGMPICGFGTDGRPVPNLDAIRGRAEIVACGWGMRGGQHTFGTMHVFQPEGARGQVFHYGHREAAALGTPGGSPTWTDVLERIIMTALEGESWFSGRRDEPRLSPALKFEAPSASIPTNVLELVDRIMPERK